jgi:hypothetical protein
MKPIAIVLSFLLPCLAYPQASAPAPSAPSAAESLDLGVRVQPLPAANRFGVEGYYVWCGAPVKGPDGKYHLFYSRWPVKAGFAPGWALRSEIAYAVADRPAGPYKHVNVALSPRGVNPATGQKYWDADVTHNANAFFFNGKFYLYYMGEYGNGKSYPMHRNHQRIGVAIADKPEGPWQRFDQPIVDITDDKKSFDSLCVTNPAACMRPDGGVVLIYKAVQYIEGKEMGGNVRYGVAMADKPEGPYVKKPGHIFEAEKPGKHWMVAEDPFIWYSEKYGKRYYAVTRDVVGTFTGASGGICLFESPDGLNWKASAHPKVLDSRFKLADGGLSDKNIERPALLIEDGEPTYLFGATDGYGKNGKLSTNVQIPLVKP